MIKNFINTNKFNISKEQIKFFENNGFLILERSHDFWNSHNVDLEYIKSKCDSLIIEEGDLAGQDGKLKIGKQFGEKGANRLKNLLAKGDCFRKLIAIPDILYLPFFLLGENFKLSSIDMREPIKNTGYQGLHLDWKQRKNKDENFFQCTAFILLDDVNENNGAIRVIPRSHKELVNIKSVSDNQDKRTKEDNNTLNMYDKKYSTLLTGKFGDIILLNVNTFHGGTNNISGERRRLIHLNYRHTSLPLNIDQYEFIPKNLHKNFNDFEKYLISLYKKPFWNKFIKKIRIKIILIYTKLFK